LQAKAGKHESITVSFVCGWDLFFEGGFFSRKFAPYNLCFCRGSFSRQTQATRKDTGWSFRWALTHLFFFAQFFCFRGPSPEQPVIIQSMFTDTEFCDLYTLSIAWEILITTATTS
jgi:hypothetical protein